VEFQFSVQNSKGQRSWSPGVKNHSNRASRLLRAADRALQLDGRPHTMSALGADIFSCYKYFVVFKQKRIRLRKKIPLKTALLLIEGSWKWFSERSLDFISPEKDKNSFAKPDYIVYVVLAICRTNLWEPWVSKEENRCAPRETGVPRIDSAHCVGTTSTVSVSDRPSSAHSTWYVKVKRTGSCRLRGTPVSTIRARCVAINDSCKGHAPSRRQLYFTNMKIFKYSPRTVDYRYNKRNKINIMIKCESKLN